MTEISDFQPIIDTAYTTITVNMATNGEANGATANEPHEIFDTILVLDFG